MESCKVHLSYNDLKPGGTLAGAVNVFTFFPDFDCYDTFLGLINFSDWCEQGEGLCENLMRYSKVSIAKRCDFQTNEDAGDKSNDVVMSDNDDAGTGLGSIIAHADANGNASAEASTKACRGRKQKLDRKTSGSFIIFTHDASFRCCTRQSCSEL